MILISTGIASGSTSRLRALGNETRLLIDDSNVFVYPSTIVEYSEVIAEPFDNWAGALYGMKGKQALGVMFNRPVPSAQRINRVLFNRLGGAFAGLNVRPWVDVVYGVRAGETGALGIGFSYAYDRNDVGDDKTGAKSADVALGLSVKQRVDLAVNLNVQRVSSEIPGNGNLSYAGTSFGFEGRGTFLSGTSRLIPMVSVSAGTHDVEDASFFNATGGIGVRVIPLESAEALIGILVGGHSETRTVGGVELTDRQIALPRLIGAAEAGVGSVSARVGFERSAVLTIDQEVGGETRGFDTPFRIEFGLGFRFGSVTLDGVVEKDFFRDGPYLIGGNRHGGGFFSNATLTYRL
jgi:hypothetical protein